MSDDERKLGMHLPIDRRDFLDGVAITAAVLAAGPALAASGRAPQDMPGYYPPLLTGLRGSHAGSFEAAHAARDGNAPAGPVTATGEEYDLVVVGAGISGLAAAWFYRAARPKARILILDNHDDFGGHAKRNEYRLGGKLHLMNGGTLQIDSPRPYGPVPAGLLKSLGIDPVALTAACRRPEIYTGLRQAVFFDKASFGKDALVAGLPRDEAANPAAWAAFLAKTPLSAAARDDVLRVETGSDDPLPGLTEDARADRLSRLSYQAWLADYRHIGSEAMRYYQTMSQGEWGAGIDAVSALDAWGFGFPGFIGLKLAPRTRPRMSFTPAGYIEGGSDTFHFPDGNASIARLLVRALVPGAIPGSSATDVVTARCDYARLDAPGNAARIRLSSIVTGARHRGAATGPVDVTYVRGGKRFSVTADAVVLACWNAMIPHLVPELPEPQKAALHELVKAPLVYTSVALRNWQAFKKAGVSRIRAPGSYFTAMALNAPVDIGGYVAERDPAKPILLFLTRTPCAPGLPEHDQNRAGRAELLATPFATFEREIRAQLGAALGASGFDPARDITGITVNRWPHGYAPEYNYLWLPDLPEAQMPHIIGRQRFGRIAIANSDSGNGAYTDVAIEQGHRAVMELLGSGGPA
jgi:spermidine dehydrogenase